MAVWTDILTELKSGIDGMTAAGIYNYDYDNVDEYRPASKTYPSCMVTYAEEEARDDDESPIDSYNVDREVTFVVTVDDTVTPVDTYMDLVLEDFKRLLDFEHGDLNCQGLVVEKFLTSERIYTHVRARPGVITMTWNFNYRVRASNPAVTT